MEHKTLPPPNYHQENSNLHRARREIGPKPQALRNQCRPSQQDINPKIRNSDKMTTKSSNSKALINTMNQETQAQTSQNNPSLLEDAPICTGTQWPKAGRMSGNLFENRKDWLILPTNNANDKNSDTATATNPKPPHKIRTPKPRNPKGRKMWMGTKLPISKRKEEDWNCNSYKPAMTPRAWSKPHLKTLSLPRLNPLERLNEKYNLDCFSSSELDSESDEGEDYRFQHHYETLI